MKLKLMILLVFLLLTGCSCKIGPKNQFGNHTHEYGDWTITTEPTCTEPGQMIKVCECGDEFVESIDALEHDLVYRDGLEATCTTEGHTSYFECSRCNYTDGYFVIETDQENHNYSDWIEIKEPKCNEPGQKKKVCECGDEVIENINIPHSYANGKCYICGISILTYELSNDGTYYIVKRCDKEYEGQVTIPSSYCDIPVKEIRASAFSGCNILKVVISNGIEIIGSNAFLNCKNLVIVELPDSIIRIKTRAFEGCSNLKNIEIPSSVTTIESPVFFGCSSLASIEVQFDNPCYKSIDGNLYTKDKNKLIQYAIGKQDGIFIIPDSVTTIGNCAFGGCTNLSKITIPTTVTKIESQAFYSCSNLTSIILPDSVTSIGKDAFSKCSSLKFNEYDNVLYLGNETNPYFVLIDGKNDAITTCEVNDKCKIISAGAFYQHYFLTNITIPNSVIIIESKAFEACSSLTSVTIPDSVITIGSEAFKDCSNLTSVSIPNSVTNIGSSAFLCCLNLTSITIPNNITTIKSNTFGGCSSLTNVTISNSVTTIEYDAFAACSSLTSISYNGTKEEWNSINKDYNWKSNSPVTVVHCTDGDVEI